MFIIFVFSANVLAMKHKRKTLTAHDVLDAMDEMEFESFIEPLKEGLEGIPIFIFCIQIYLEITH